VDMRKGIQTLAGLVAQAGHDVAAGDTFLFLGRSRKRAKCLWFDDVCARLLVSRIDRGCFAPLWRDDGKEVELSSRELLLLLEGSKLVGRMALTPSPIDRKAAGRISATSFR
jgi:transposase